LFFRGLFIHFKLKSISFFCLNIHLFFDRGLISIFALTKKDACKTVVVLVLLVICKRLKCIWNTDLYSKKKKKMGKSWYAFFLLFWKFSTLRQYLNLCAKIQKVTFLKLRFLARKFKKLILQFVIKCLVFGQKNIFGAKIQSWFFQFELNFSTKNEIFRIFV